MPCSCSGRANRGFSIPPTPPPPLPGSKGMVLMEYAGSTPMAIQGRSGRVYRFDQKSKLFVDPGDLYDEDSSKIHPTETT